jgi:pyruvate,water dikinase
MKHSIDLDKLDLIKAKTKGLGGMSFAVRSSSASEDGTEYSWAGQMTSILGVREEDLDRAIKTCWSSFFSSQALSYRLVNSLPLEIGNNAVIVQKMIKSDFSGVAFSVDPRCGNKKRIVVEAVSGLGEALVSGKIMPIRYIFDKESFELIEYAHVTQKMSYMLDSSGKAKWIGGEDFNSNELCNENMRELLKIISSLELAWNCPIDIEWAIEKDQLYILQCRPVTNLV